MRYRSRTEIVAEMLEATKKPATRTQIMYKAFVSHAQLKEYLEVLEENDLVVHDEKNEVYRTATRGLQFLEIYQQMGQIMFDEKNRNESVLTAGQDSRITNATGKGIPGSSRTGRPLVDSASDIRQS